MNTLTQDDVALVRGFTRLWTQRAGVLDEGLLDTRWSLTEARVLYELAQRAQTSTVDLRAALGLDAGYLSRVLARLEEAGVVVRTRSREDLRRQVLSLTEAGREVCDDLDARSGAQVRALLDGLGADARARLVAGLAEATAALDGGRRDRTVVLRAPEAGGDLGWVVERHGALYAAEVGWDASFEALVAQIMGDFGTRHAGSARARGWIAEVGGRRAGSIFCVPWDEDPDSATAQLRCLVVEPFARGAGVGGRLVEECLRFARRAGYGRVVLWTNDVLADARRLYERAGFAVEWSGPHEAFGATLVQERWARDL